MKCLSVHHPETNDLAVTEVVIGLGHTLGLSAELVPD